MAQNIDYWLSVLSPWCYLAGDRLERIAARHGATVTYRPLDVLALFDRTGGVRPVERHPSRVAYRAQELPRWAAHLGLPIHLRPAHWPVNAAPASYAILAAQADGGGDVGALVQGFLRAVWAEQRDISDEATVRAVLTDAGFDAGLADRGLLGGAEGYARNLEQAAEAGVFGTPFYIVTGRDQRFWGQDRLEFLDRALAEG